MPKDKNNKNHKYEAALAFVLEVLAEKIDKDDFVKIYNKVIQESDPESSKDKVKPAPLKLPKELPEMPVEEYDEDTEEIEDIFLDSSDDDAKQYVGFCSSCGDGVIIPFVWSINTPNKNFKLPVQMCNKCRTIYTQYEWFSAFIESIVKALGGSIIDTTRK